MVKRTVTKKCEGCGKLYKFSSYYRKYRKFCSDKCCHNFRMGKNHPAWREDAKPHAIHEWLRRWKNKPNYCERCGRTNCILDWANIDHKYRRCIDDFICLCRSCHRKMDMTPEKRQKAIENLPWYRKRIK